jgi:hypothetical protein
MRFTDIPHSHQIESIPTTQPLNGKTAKSLLPKPLGRRCSALSSQVMSRTAKIYFSGGDKLGSTSADP